MSDIINFDLKFKEDTKKRFLIGVDEAGRGPVAGPVVSCACFIKDYSIPLLLQIKDSKKLSSSEREKIFSQIIRTKDISFYFSYATPQEIDSINILNATLLSMKRSVEGLIKRNLFSCQSQDILVIVDGNRKIKDLNFENIPVVKGDDKSAVIGCASIIAKVIRDRWMDYYDTLYPYYGFKKHRGYPTSYHIEMIRKYGLSPIHRVSFSPCRLNLNENRI